MTISFVTIVLDGMPFIDKHIETFSKLKNPWHWYIVEGQAAPTADTAWCKPMPFRLSSDGTTEYLNSLKSRSDVTIIQSSRWINKTAMMNAATTKIKDPGVLIQVDCDEFWTSDQLDKIADTFSSNSLLNRMHFYCRFFVGPDIVIKEDGTTQSKPGDWIRAWRFSPGMIFDKHEPPILSGNTGLFADRDITKSLGLMFDHYAYATDRQAAYKERFYGYRGAQTAWRRLQENKHWPTRLKTYFYWVDDRCIAERINWKAPFVCPILSGGPRPDDVTAATNPRPPVGQVVQSRPSPIQSNRLPSPRHGNNRVVRTGI